MERFADTRRLGPKPSDGPGWTSEVRGTSSDPGEDSTCDVVFRRGSEVVLFRAVPLELSVKAGLSPEAFSASTGLKPAHVAAGRQPETAEPQLAEAG